MVINKNLWRVPHPLRRGGRAIHYNLFLRRPIKKGFSFLSLTLLLNFIQFRISFAVGLVQNRYFVKNNWFENNPSSWRR